MKDQPSNGSGAGLTEQCSDESLQAEGLGQTFAEIWPWIAVCPHCRTDLVRISRLTEDQLLQKHARWLEAGSPPPEEFLGDIAGLRLGQPPISESLHLRILDSFLSGSSGERQG